MVNTYKEIRDENGSLIKGRTHLFVTSCDDAGNITGCQSGTNIVPEGAGMLFVVEDWLIGQENKLLCINGQLEIKNNETLDIPEKTAEDIEREQLLARLAELDAQEPTQ